MSACRVKISSSTPEEFRRWTPPASTPLRLPRLTEQLTADPGPKLGAQPKVRFCSTPASSEPWIIVRGENKRDGNPSRNPSPGPIQLGNRFDVLGNSEQQLSAAGLTEADPSPAATAHPSAGRSSTRRRLLKEAVSRRSADAARADGGTHPGAVSSVRGSSPYSLANDSRRISPPLPRIAMAMRNSVPTPLHSFSLQAVSEDEVLKELLRAGPKKTSRV
ncbi:hypothetical protein SKAU_G00209290 [Synaphobranchus kaupii]|uniref:Uncharacterized protein n=1 Tax=Synaphobranchus kaupii TaxID=118154 RepID=A0A9Q1F8T1_SYNKA|nr:hypothetical protein SKAU_G00209290 [Synaphobranchus kaupii]